MQSLPAVLFEDENLIAFDKPSGLLTAPDGWDQDRINLMTMIHKQISSAIFNIHRLDRETSGVLLCSKDKKSLDNLSSQFQSRTVTKRYLAITQGTLPKDELTIHLPIAEDKYQLGKMRVSRSLGKPCETFIKGITRWRGYSLAEIFPKTGRTHQIRVHLASQGCPVLGDALYGSGQGLLLSVIKTGYKHKKDEPERPLLGRLALHAESIAFTHPTTRKLQTIRSPLPRDFEVAIKYLKRFAGL